jgi:alpha-N-arabinofuranosidase
VRVEFESPVASFAVGAEKRTLPALAGSASVKGNVLTLSVTNAHARVPMEAVIDVGGRAVGEIGVSTLTHGDLHAHNTFESPTTLVPVDRRSTIKGEFRWTFAPASVTVIRVRL